MSGDVLIRSVVAPLDVAGDGRTVIGVVAPYDRVAVVDDGFGPYRESFDRRAFSKVITCRAQAVRVHVEHPGSWVGRGDRWMDSDRGLSMAMRLDDTEAGRTAAYKIRDGQLPGLSIGFVPGRTVTKMTADGPVETRVSIRSIHHVALVPQGAYEQAEVTAVRHASADRVALWQLWLDAQRSL